MGPSGDGSWMEEIESRLRDRAGSAPIRKPEIVVQAVEPLEQQVKPDEPPHSPLALPESEIDSLISRFRK